MTILKSYLDATGEKQSEFAERTQTTPATISRLCSGALKPGLELAHRIEEATSGEVLTETWVTQHPETLTPAEQAA